MSSSHVAQKKNLGSTVYDGWLLFAELAGRMNSKIIVGIIYFLLVSLVWLFTKFFLKDRPLLDREFRLPDPSSWKKKAEAEQIGTLETMRRQF